MFGVCGNITKHSLLICVESKLLSKNLQKLNQQFYFLRTNRFIKHLNEKMPRNLGRKPNRGFKRHHDNYMGNYNSGNYGGGMSSFHLPSLMHPSGMDNDPSVWFEPYNNDCSSSMGEPSMPKTRTVNCGELRENNDGETVEISGRIQNQQLGRFVVIKDSHGATQLVAQDENIVRRLQKIPVNANITVLGLVKRRPARQINEKIATGGIEVKIIDILSVRRASTLSSAHKPAKLQQTLQTRSKIGNVIKITSTEVKRCTEPAIKEAFLQRSHTCGELGAEHVGLKVNLCGWICHNHFCKFIHLKDGYGVVQAVVPLNKTEIADILKDAENESVVAVTGVVKYRPTGHESPALETGLIEVIMDKLIMAKDYVPTEKSPKDDTGNVEEDSKNSVNLFTKRTHTCGQLREEHIGEDVILCGWLEFERMKKFVIIRDSYGSTQCVISEERQDLIDLITKTPLESVIQINGTVASRPPNSIKSSSPTGQIEVCINDIKVLNKAALSLPFNIREHQKPKESLRMQHRYLDLRFPDMQYNLRMRSKALMRMREYLINKCDFVDVETPTLFRRTPGGAQEFVVPTQIAGRCYALTQSPQQLKQMLMVGGIDRYFQIARCYRDERGRSDRQPEFTQLDIEMSFIDQDCVMNLIEKMIKYVFSEQDISLPFRRMTYDEAMMTYGTDKPDTRFGYTLRDCTEEFLSNSDVERCNNFGAFAIVISRSESSNLPTSIKNSLERWNKKYSKTKFVHSVIPSSTTDWIGKMTPLLTEKVAKSLMEKLKFQSNNLVLLAYGDRKHSMEYLGRIRLEYMKFLEHSLEIQRADTYDFVWITDFPLFESGEDAEGTLQSVHHPFTQPHPDDIELLDNEPLKVRSQAFDLVLNGYEIGGGSIRIHDCDLQKKILNMLKIDTCEMEHLLSALVVGCPPHGGIALGIDRFICTMLKTSSIRDVIAFPKTIDGKDLLCHAPTPYLDNDIKLYHLNEIQSSNVDNKMKTESDLKQSINGETCNDSVIITDDTKEMKRS